MTLQDKAMKAARLYLERTDRKILDEDYKGFIVAQDEDGVAFVQVGCGIEDFGDDFGMSRDTFEDMSIKWFMQEHDLIDVPVRYDTIGMRIMGNNRAMLRHHVNVRLED